MLIHIIEALTIFLVMLASYRGYHQYHANGENLQANVSRNAVNDTSTRTVNTATPSIHLDDKNPLENITRDKVTEITKPEVKKDSALHDYIGDFF